LCNPMQTKRWHASLHCKSFIRANARICDAMQSHKRGSKSVGSNSMEVDSPSPAPSNLFVCHMLQGREVSKADPSGTNTVHCASRLFSIPYTLRIAVWRRPYLYRIDNRHLCSITACAADNRSARGAKPEGTYVMERTFQAIWIQDTDLIAATLLNECAV
jgi:hypothetical protein